MVFEVASAQDVSPPKFYMYVVSPSSDACLAPPLFYSPGSVKWLVFITKYLIVWYPHFPTQNSQPPSTKFQTLILARVALFKSWPEHRISWVRFLWSSSVPSGKFKDSTQQLLPYYLTDWGTIVAFVVGSIVVFSVLWWTAVSKLRALPNESWHLNHKIFKNK
jgi:hypothetical protein